MIAPLTRIVVRRNELLEGLRRAPRAFRLSCGCAGGGQLRDAYASELRAVERLKAEIVIDGLLAQASAVTPP